MADLQIVHGRVSQPAKKNQMCTKQRFLLNAEFGTEVWGVQVNLLTGIPVAGASERLDRFTFMSRIQNRYLQVFTCTCNLDSLSREVLGDVHWASIKHSKAQETVNNVS